MEQERLDTTLEQHRLWRSGQGGERANLRGADLREADLGGADLGDCVVGSNHTLGKRAYATTQSSVADRQYWMTYLHNHSKAVVFIYAGCYRGTPEAFLAAVKENQPKALRAYELAIELASMDATSEA